MTTRNDSRVERLRTHAADEGLDVVAVVPGPNMIHLTGVDFHLSERPIVAFIPVDGDAVLVVPKLEEGKAGASAIPFEVLTYDDASGHAGAYEAARRLVSPSGKTIGVEGRRMRYLEIGLIGSDAALCNADHVFARGRMRKDDEELRAMRKAAQIAETAFTRMLETVDAGTTEKQIAAELTLQLLRAESEPNFPFTPFAATGANASNPHATTSETALTPGDLVIVDWGATCRHYFSDITRTFAVAGAPVSDEMRKAYDVVREANRTGREAARPGATGQDVDRATRKVIVDAGLGEYFTHRTGHGLGLEGHEEPDMNEGSLVPLEPGMTFTVEPGVYIPGVGGVRIEDDVVITADGSESLTTLARELETV